MSYDTIVAPKVEGPLAAEFARTLQEMQIGLRRTRALRGKASRASVPELRAFISALAQAGSSASRWPPRSWWWDLGVTSIAANLLH